MNLSVILYRKTTDYENPTLKRDYNKIMLKKNNYCLILVPSQAPANLSVTAASSTSIRASWQLPPADSRNGIIMGYKLFYKKKGYVGPPTWLPIANEATLANVTWLAKDTEYEFQVLAFTSVGDGPKSSVKVERTKEDGKGYYIDDRKWLLVDIDIFLFIVNFPKCK